MGNSCCRGKDIDVNLEFYEKINAAVMAINNRETLKLIADAGSPVRWNKLIELLQALKNIELVTGKELKSYDNTFGKNSRIPGVP